MAGCQVCRARPARGIVNRMVRELGPMSSMAPEFPKATAASFWDWRVSDLPGRVGPVVAYVSMAPRLSVGTLPLSTFGS